MARRSRPRRAKRCQRRSDEAIYARRNAAVEQERRIKESELNTEIAVEEKKRQIRETQDGGGHRGRGAARALIEQRVENERKDADAPRTRSRRRSRRQGASTGAR